MTASSDPASTRGNEPAPPRHVVLGLPAGRDVVFARQAFTAWMRENAHAPIRLITGGTGHGKTSALLAWARDAAADEGLVIWVGTDAGVRTRTSFWLYVLHLLGSGGVPIEIDLVRALDAHDGRALPALLPRQFGASGPVAIIVDARPDLPETAVLADLHRLAEHVPGIRVVLATRLQVEDLEEIRSSNAIAAAPPALLLFSDDEIIALAKGKGISLPAQDAARIRAASAGWPPAVLALLQSGEPHTDHLPSILLDRVISPFRSAPGFEGLLVASLDETARVDELASPDALPAVRRTLDAVAASGYGAWADEERAAFRLHPLLRRALSQEFASADPAGLRAAHRRLAALRQRRRGSTLNAFGHAIDSQDWELSARVYRSHLITITGRSESSVLATRGIPSRAQQEFPILRFAAALDHYANGRVARAVQGFTALLAVAEARHIGRRAETLDDLWVQALVMIALRLLGRFEMARSALRRLEKMIERTPDPDGEIEEARGMLLTHGAITLILADYTTEAAQLIEEAGIDPLPDRPVSERARLFGMRALVFALRGEIRAAEETLAARAALPLPVGFDDTYSALTSMVAAALVHLERGDTANAAEALTHTEAHASTTELWPLLLLAHTLVHWQLHGPAAALGFLDATLLERGSKGAYSPFAVRIVAVLRVNLLLAIGRFADARMVLGQVPQRRARRWSVLRAQLELLAGDPGRAAGIATAASADAATPRERLTLQVIASTAARRTGDHATASALGTVAASVTERHGLILPLTVVPLPDAVEVIASSPESAARLGVHRTYPEVAAPTTALSARESIVLRQLVDGTPVEGIAVALSVSRNTVKSQLRSVYRKLGVTNRADAIAEARRRHLL